MRIKLIIEYDGTNYAGWQRQLNGIGIQQVIEDALFKLTGEKTVVAGAGRTDAGVHALAQVAHFDTESTIPPDKFSFALNTMLPPDIRIKESSKAENGFHARFNAKGKCYIYRIYNGRHSSPLLRLTHAHIALPLNVDAMNKAAQLFVGKHDFVSFSASDRRKGSTVRTIYTCQVSGTGEEITVTVKGDGFLYNMVRIITGTLIEVGLGKRDLDSIKKALETRDRTLAGITAPANGLTLKEVYY
ncbi:MAG TPA: tRNA pseudouridine(38-40) synthase TruA [Clostridia bacterium]|nr:tRNA pseudouridine(38-40) synthase TruA [Clostridia bacterium]